MPDEKPAKARASREPVTVTIKARSITWGALQLAHGQTHELPPDLAAALIARGQAVAGEQQLPPLPPKKLPSKPARAHLRRDDMPEAHDNPGEAKGDA